MFAVSNPALRAFEKQIAQEWIVAQLLIRRDPEGFELRHAEDSEAPAESLRLVPVKDLRQIAQFTATGAYRPLKSAPTLQRAWRSHAADSAELEHALNCIYPGAIADWYAVNGPSPAKVTHFREFTERQSGMYRITAKLSDAQAARVIRAGCHRSVCLKRRLWTVAGLSPDPEADKSAIPCLEPCPLLLEFARKAMRLEQEERIPIPLPADDIKVVIAALEQALNNPPTTAREADFDEPLNPRRLRLTLERFQRLES